MHPRSKATEDTIAKKKIPGLGCRKAVRSNGPNTKKFCGKFNSNIQNAWQTFCCVWNEKNSTCDAKLESWNGTLDLGKNPKPLSLN